MVMLLTTGVSCRSESIELPGSESMPVTHRAVWSLLLSFEE